MDTSTIILYSTHCAKCNVLSKKLQQKNIEYEEVNDVDIMTSKGIMQAPMLEVNGKLLNFKEAVDWVNSRN